MIYRVKLLDGAATMINFQRVTTDVVYIGKFIAFFPVDTSNSKRVITFNISPAFCGIFCDGKTVVNKINKLPSIIMQLDSLGL